MEGRRLRLLRARGVHGTAMAPNLFVVPPSAALRQGGVFQPAVMRTVIERCAGGFHYVLIDGPPVLESPDSAPLSAVVDGVVLVVQAGRTKRPVMVRATDLLHKAGARVLGSLLNRRVLEIPGFIYRRI